MKLILACRLLALLLLLGAVIQHSDAVPAPDLEDQTRAISTELRCVVCQNLSVADSPSEMAQQMRAIVREQLQAGKSPDQIKEFFVSKYGEWVLLKPRTTGFSVLLWTLPYVVLVLGVVAALWLVHRWTRRKKTTQPTSVSTLASGEARAELLHETIEEPDLEDSSARAQLLREHARLRGELAELDFDFQSGKLSQSDYTALKQEIEAKSVNVVNRLAVTPAEAQAKAAIPA